MINTASLHVRYQKKIHQDEKLCIFKLHKTPVGLVRLIFQEAIPWQFAQKEGENMPKQILMIFFVHPPPEDAVNPEEYCYKISNSLHTLNNGLICYSPLPFCISLPIYLSLFLSSYDVNYHFPTFLQWD